MNKEEYNQLVAILATKTDKLQKMINGRWLEMIARFYYERGIDCDILKQGTILWNIEEQEEFVKLVNEIKEISDKLPPPKYFLNSKELNDGEKE